MGCPESKIELLRKFRAGDALAYICPMALVLAACAPVPDGQEVVVRDSLGIRIVESHQQTWSDDEACPDRVLAKDRGSGPHRRPVRTNTQGSSREPGCARRRFFDGSAFSY